MNRRHMSHFAAALIVSMAVSMPATVEAQLTTKTELGLTTLIPDSLLNRDLDRIAARAPAAAEAPILLKSSHMKPIGVDHHADEFVPDGFCCAEPNLGMTMFFVMALEVIPNYFNWRVADDSTAKLSLDSFEYNMTHGFEWDHNNFTTNMFAHPYHGNVYYNSARAHGYNYWASSFFAGLGSFIWEMYGENNRGAINDWVMTTMGGITIGETLHRSAKMLRNNEQRGVGRSMREFGAFFLDPVGSVSRSMRGETSKVGPNPVDRYPDSGGLQVSVGYRQVGNPKDDEEGTPTADTTATPYVDMTMRYGDPLTDHERPFDAFRFAAQMNFSDKVPVGRMSINAVLWGRKLKEGNTRHSLTFDQWFLYLENRAAETGGQFFGISLHSAFKFSDDWALRTTVQPIFAVLTGINSEYGELTGRPYDFGTGGGINLGGTLSYKGYPVLRLAYTDLFSATINGAKGRHNVAIPVIQARWKIAQSVGIGADYWTLIRHSFYDDFRTTDGDILVLDDISRVSPTFRLNVTFTWFRAKRGN